LFAGDDLLASEKDRAENVRIVDLLRNDLSRVCEADSVRVTQLCSLESYQFVQHLFRRSKGPLAPGKTAIDLVRAGVSRRLDHRCPEDFVRWKSLRAGADGSRAICGCLGYFGFDGSMDLNILIRTITASRGWWPISRWRRHRGPIVAEREYEETWHKAEGCCERCVDAPWPARVSLPATPLADLRSTRDGYDVTLIPATAPARSCRSRPAVRRCDGRKDQLGPPGGGRGRDGRTGTPLPDGVLASVRARGVH